MADARGILWRMLAPAVAGLALAAPGGAMAGPPAGPELQAWLARTTDLKSAQIALVGDDSIYSLEPLGAPLPTGEVIVLVRTEPLADDWGAAHGFWSWDANLLIDCPQRRLQVMRSATYPQRNRGGKPAPEPQDYAAMTPLAREPAAKLVAAACDADFAWPLRPRLRMAQAMVDPAELLPAPAAPAPIGWVVQVAQGPSEEGARRAVGAARKALGADAKTLAGWTTAALGSGDMLEHTGLLGAFPSSSAAYEACEALRKAKQDCLVRRGASEPASANVAAAATAPPREVASVAAPPAPAGPTTYAVQVARGPSEDGARRALAKARKTLGALAQTARDALPLSRVPGDHLRYEARLEGFPTAEAAGDACRRLSSAGQDCFALEVSASD